MQPREREPGLGLNAGRREHPATGIRRQPDGRREQRRLPDPGLAADYQRAAGPLGKPADEADHDLKFVLTPVQRLTRRTGRHETLSLPPALPEPGRTQLAMGCRTLQLSPGEPEQRTINHDAAHAQPLPEDRQRRCLH